MSVVLAVLLGRYILTGFRSGFIDEFSFSLLVLRWAANAATQLKMEIREGTRTRTRGRGYQCCNCLFH